MIGYSSLRYAIPIYSMKGQHKFKRSQGKVSLGKFMVRLKDYLQIFRMSELHFIRHTEGNQANGQQHQ